MKTLLLHACRGLTLSLAFSAAALAAEPTETDARREIETLRREIARHDTLYHRHAAPEIADADYDRLKRTLDDWEQRFPAAARAAAPLAELGDDRSGLFQTQRHGERMLSLDKAYAPADVRAFHARLAKALGRDDLAYVVEPKFDGLAISVTFERGKLVRAVTRGNGVEGEDVTANALRVAGLPRVLAPAAAAAPDRIEVRGEIYVSFAELARVNAEREAAGEPRFANPRNLAAGTLRQLDPGIVAARGLQVVFFGIGACEPAAALPATQRELHARFKAWGLPTVPDPLAARGADELVRAIARLEQAREGFAFPTDGAVVKLDSLALQREAGVAEHAPRWALAYKFAPERAEAQVRAITIQVGRTGVLTPVAELAPVQLGGSTIARATLHNFADLARRDVRVGDTVFVEKAGDIIPAVVGVNLARRPADAVVFAAPAACPDCRAAVTRRDGEAALRCPNLACGAQLRRRLEHFASKAAVDIEGLGPTTIDALVARGLVRDLPDLYRLRREDLAALGRGAGKANDALLAAIDASRRAELWRVIHGLGLPQIGAVAAREHARAFGSLEAFAAAQPDPRHRALIADLIAAGVRPRAPGATTSAVFAGKTLVVTGTLPGFTRAQATAAIEAAGGRVASGVSRTTHLLVAGAEPGVKLEQARALGVRIIDEAELRRLLAGE